jgi:hypothetical protein
VEEGVGVAENDWRRAARVEVMLGVGEEEANSPKCCSSNIDDKEDIDGDRRWPD